MKNIALACDHAAVSLKIRLRQFLESQGYTCFDCGTDSSASVDYPDFAQRACKRVQKQQSDLAVLLCGTGIGMSIAANKMKNIRAAVVCNEQMASMAKQHNNANVLCLGARLLSEQQAKNILQAWLSNTFEGGRHQRRVDKMMKG